MHLSVGYSKSNAAWNNSVQFLVKIEKPFEDGLAIARPSVLNERTPACQVYTFDASAMLG